MTELSAKASGLGIDLSVSLAGVDFSNPLMTASGTFAPRESSSFYDLSELGAAVTKGVSADPWEGNPTPRIAEAYGGVLNSVGLENKGAEWYKNSELPYLRQYDTKIICNLAGHSVEEYVRVTEALSGCEEIDLFELNISCPNVSSGGMAFGTDPEAAASVIRAVRQVTDKPVIAKLSPNVTDIAAIARSCEAAGADGITAINTLLGMKIDLKTRKPILANIMGGFSGPAVFPVALRAVWQISRAVDIPVIGCGGITTAADVLEMMMAGAAAVQVGSANLVDPYACKKIIEALPETMRQYGISSLQELNSNRT